MAPSQAPTATAGGEAVQLLWRSSSWVAFARPLDVAVAKDGRVYVREVDKDQITTLTPDGYITKSWGERGKSQGQFDFTTTPMSTQHR